MDRITTEQAERFARLALDCVEREYPNKIAHVMTGDADVKPPRELHPIFYGCFDWHSSVHGHWLLVRILRLFPETAASGEIEAVLNRAFTAEKAAAEAAYFKPRGRAAYERPYGLAWFLQLTAELREWKDPRAARWLTALEPLEQICAENLRTWIPKMGHPIRTGEHAQSAFAFGLAYDWAVTKGDREMRDLIRTTAEQFHARDQNAPLRFEPSSQDFLSPSLAVADLMRRFYAPTHFAAWLGAYLPEIPIKEQTDWLEPATVTDATDGKLAHLDGLNLSRAWMLEGIVAGLPAHDPRRASLTQAAQHHRTSGLAAVTGAHYEGGHWLGSFAVYLVTARGIPTPR
ncbi:DUF2891 family protein [Acanthopleuribacter pedis]|uniref:DUF2891 domain-containing protein n=1 Tax=Acanthopleuribacter pedis TaxID=442870 RepID=A0A8J7QBB4_9BACT|nr:DUF2891 domain-containing protein [Acanthopleuribacter pedis]